MKRARDNQRSAVYKWENEAVAHHAPLLQKKIDEQQAAELIARIWREQATRFGKLIRKPPAMRFRCGGARSFYSPRDHSVALLPVHQNFFILIHETAHALNHAPGMESHGPRFVAIYIFLLTAYGGADHDQLRASAAEHGIRVHDRFRVAARLGDTIRHHLPASVIELAVATGKSYREIQGALIGPIRRGEIVRRGKVYREAIPAGQ